MTILPTGNRAVMNQRLDPLDSLDFFPTPPWATRALTRRVMLDLHGTCWEPAAGAGHMAEVLRETFGDVYASDINDYGRGYTVGSFAGRTDVPQAEVTCPFTPDWIISNPPFNAAAEFAIRAINVARRGVALLVRSNWAEGVERYNELFRVCPPAIVAQFVERVPMVKGCWDPDASTSTAYAWFIWDRVRTGTHFAWIAPGCRTALEMPNDRRRFAAWMFEEPATIEEDVLCRALRDSGATVLDMRTALRISDDRLTRFLRDIDKADKKARKAAKQVAA